MRISIRTLTAVAEFGELTRGYWFQVWPARGALVRRFLELHWLSRRNLFFFAGSGRCCLSCAGPTRAGFCGLASGRSTLTRRRSLLARSAPLASLLRTIFASMAMVLIRS
jgi:hypothetical protein